MRTEKEGVEQWLAYRTCSLKREFPFPRTRGKSCLESLTAYSVVIKGALGERAGLQTGCALTTHGQQTSLDDQMTMGRGAEGELVVSRGAKATGNVASL